MTEGEFNNGWRLLIGANLNTYGKPISKETFFRTLSGFSEQVFNGGIERIIANGIPSAKEEDANKFPTPYQLKQACEKMPSSNDTKSTNPKCPLCNGIGFIEDRDKKWGKCPCRKISPKQQESRYPGERHD